MTLFILGLIIFLGMHSIRVFAEPTRTALVRKLGQGGYMALYSVASLVGIVLISMGYGQARLTSGQLWVPPWEMRWVTIFGTLVAFVFLAAYLVPRNRLRQAVGHPMVIGIMIWALVHLFINGRVVDVMLFVAFLVWAKLSFLAARRRDRIAPPAVKPVIGFAGDIAVVVGGLALWMLFGAVLHQWLIGVRAFV